MEWLQGELCCAGHGNTLRTGARRNWTKVILRLLFKMQEFLFCSWAQCSPSLQQGWMSGGSWKRGRKHFGVTFPTPRGRICRGSVSTQYLNPEEEIFMANSLKSMLVCLLPPVNKSAFPRNQCPGHFIQRFYWMASNDAQMLIFAMIFVLSDFCSLPSWDLTAHGLM